MDASTHTPAPHNDPRDTPPQVELIAGGLVFDGDSFALGDISIVGNAFSQVGDVSIPYEKASAPQGCVVDARDGYVIPGLVDIHFHGCMGHDFSDGTPEALHAIARYEARSGVTSICPASMTLPTETLRGAFANAAFFAPEPGEASLVGINMEGPYISPSKVGAQNPAYVRPASSEEFDLLQDAADGLIKIVDIAPEEPGALAFVDAAAEKTRVSVAHTCADYGCAAEAFERGARHITHLYNAMPPLHHRDPGPIAAGAERDDVTAEVIADGVHVHPSMVRLAFSLFGRDRTILISDTMRACGLADGIYDLGGQDVTVRGPEARIADGSLAGSVTDLMGCLVTAVEQMEIPLEDAVRAATLNPARAIGVDGQRGGIAAGKIADAVVLNRDLSVRHVVLRGRLVR